MKDSLTPVSKVPKAIVVYELFIGLIETVSALSLIVFGKNILSTYENFVNSEMFEEANDLIVKLMENMVPNLFKHRNLIIFTLLIMGLIKLISAYGIFRKKIWAEHLLILFLTFLIPFEFVSIIVRFSLFEVMFFVVNIMIVLILVKFKPREYYTKLIEDLNL